MLTKVVYNCSPDTLGDVSPEDFADAFENEVRVRPLFRDVQIEVTFDEAARSGLSEIWSDDADADISHEDEIRSQFREFAEKAFAACL